MIQFSWSTQRLIFKFEAGTSRGVLTERPVFFIHATDAHSNITGIGEASPIDGLSPEHSTQMPALLNQACEALNQMHLVQGTSLPLDTLRVLTPKAPSIRFGIETALADLANGGLKCTHDTSFYRGTTPIPINGLVWMGKPDFMQAQIEAKIAEGFNCIKLKVGALDFAAELELIKGIRKRFSAAQINIRVDANGAFSAADAMQKLEALAPLHIHSIEQPIKPGQHETLRFLCAHSPVAIALDEELIGDRTYQAKLALVQQIKPQYLVIKPSLTGGFSETLEWIQTTTKTGADWWITSALESNIGLNAIAQFTASLKPELPQGLGTGQLYHNNIASPLEVKGGYLWHHPKQGWGNFSD